MVTQAERKNAIEGIADTLMRNSRYALIKRVLPIEPVEIKLVWHNLTRVSAAHEWMCTEVVKACMP